MAGMQFDVHEAKTQFSKLIAAVERGGTVTICRNGRPVIACVLAGPLGPFAFGACGSVPGGAASLDHMIGPIDGETQDDMGLRCSSTPMCSSRRCWRRGSCPAGREALVEARERCVSAASLYEISRKTMPGR